VEGSRPEVAFFRYKHKSMAKRGEKRERRSMVWEPDAPGIDMGGAGCITPDNPSSESIRPVLRQNAFGGLLISVFTLEAAPRTHGPALPTRLRA
jgi:hypothetical protein